MYRLDSAPSSRVKTQPGFTETFIAELINEPYELVLDEGESVTIERVFVLECHEEDKKPILVRSSGMGNEPFVIANLHAKTDEEKEVDFLIRKSCILSHTCVDGIVFCLGYKAFERPWRIAVDDDEIDEEPICESIVIDGREVGVDYEVGEGPRAVVDDNGGDDDDDSVDSEACNDDDDDEKWSVVEFDFAAYREKLLAADGAALLQPPLPRPVKEAANEDSDQVSMEVTDQVYFDIEINGRSAGRIKFGLYGKAVPKTAETFRALCTGEKKISGNYYKGSKFHLIYHHYLIVAGALTNGGDYKANLEPENLKIKPDTPGMLVMTNNGQYDGSEFSIITDPTKWISTASRCRCAVVIGKVLVGMEVVYKIVAKATSSGVPKSNVTIADSGSCK